MGRYYSGDINGKFWFGVQSSDDSEFFGGLKQEPNHVTYMFEKENDFESVRLGINKCKESLGKYHKPLHDFFYVGEGKEGYNEEMIMKALGIDRLTVDNLLVWYARLQLGGKIYKCLKENGYCEFEAEF
jgi:hypothetical protein